jgi:hypothetical protein
VFLYLPPLGEVARSAVGGLVFGWSVLGSPEGEGVDATPTPASPVLPPEGEDLVFLDLPPLGEVARSAVGGLDLAMGALEPQLRPQMIGGETLATQVLQGL